MLHVWYSSSMRTTCISETSDEQQTMVHTIRLEDMPRRSRESCRGNGLCVCEVEKGESWGVFGVLFCTMYVCKKPRILDRLRGSEV